MISGDKSFANTSKTFDFPAIKGGYFQTSIVEKEMYGRGLEF